MSRTCPILVSLAAALLFCACPLRSSAPKAAAPAATSAETQTESKGPDPRAAFESSGLLGGISTAPETPVRLIAPAGIPEAGVSLALGGALSTAAIARRTDPSSASLGFGHELALASGARASLPGPVLAMASEGERIVVSCADLQSAFIRARAFGGALICFKTEGEGERLVEVWKSEGPVCRSRSWNN